MTAAAPIADAPLVRVTLREGAADALRAAVLSGHLPPGAPVVEVALARTLGISRAPLREAIRELLEEGLLVQHRAWGGVSVAPLDAVIAQELYTLRATLEIFAFECAWERRDAGFRSALAQRHDATRRRWCDAAPGPRSGGRSDQSARPRSAPRASAAA